MSDVSLFNLTGPDLILIFFIILLLFGAKELPGLSKRLGQAVRDFGRAKDDFERGQREDPVEPVPDPKWPSNRVLWIAFLLLIAGAIGFAASR